ncbi:hypothetical protein [Spirosoma sp. KUDC1026]|uniref:hypothetical protein n=1 Tax=Spirosoma sp. KUDC1026 TaxID=2745947 RepID=UPI00159B86F8|nr:hypothetical protein [Spirosoma sp. KUDC1026]QKZ13484.1 hypothetical protein HU175_12910 [Spirosoma sp. KUDC1026]
MKTIFATLSLCLLGFTYSQAQSTTGGKSGGSTASTGTGYLTEGKRPTTSMAQSMTIADEGSSRSYMYVPPKAKTKNRSASPDGTGSQPTTTKKTATTKKTTKSGNR